MGGSWPKWASPKLRMLILLANVVFFCSGTNFIREAKANYKDGVSLVDPTLPSARILSNLVFQGPSGIPNRRNLTTMLVFFSDVVSHEIMEMGPGGCPRRTIKIPVPLCDPVYDAKCLGKTQIPYVRMRSDPTSGRSFNAPRDVVNDRTTWIDGSFLYSSREPWSNTLRAFRFGRLLEGTVAGYPMLNEQRVPVINPAPPQINRLLDSSRLFVLGDPDANENPGRLSLAIILFRWHNYQANRVHLQNPNWSDEQIFQGARRLVIANLQKIILYDYVPALIGEPLAPYPGYSVKVTPAISTEFAAAAFRFPASMVPPALLLRKKGAQCAFRQPDDDTLGVRICQNWWNAQDTIQYYSADEFVLGMASQIAEADDNIFVEDMRDYHYGPSHFTRTDTVATIIMQGRDAGMGTYNRVRDAFGLPPRNWSDINPQFFASNPQVLAELMRLYNNDIGQLDTFVGGTLESDQSGMGELFKTIIKDQFQRIRNGDRFWFENRRNQLFTEQEIVEIRNTTLADIIRITTETQLIQDDVFRWRQGDPCPQPLQIDGNGLKPCEPLYMSTMFSGNEVSYVFTLAGLCAVPIVCLLFGVAMTQHRDKLGWQMTYDQLALTASGTKKEISEYDVYYTCPAFEWLQEEYVRQVVIEVEQAQLTVRKPRGGVLRKLLFEKEVRIQMMHSPPRAASNHGPYVLLSLPKTHDLVIRLPTDKHLGQLIAALVQAVAPTGGQVYSSAEQNDIILGSAETKQRRQERLDNFFREAYARIFEDHNLTDVALDQNTAERDEVLSETITRHEFAQAMGMKEGDLFVRRMFAVAAKKDDEFMSFSELLGVLKEFASATASEKYRLLFRMCDLSGTGRVKRKEFADFVRSLNKVAGVTIDENTQTTLIDSVLHWHGIKDAEYMTIEDFETIFGGLEEKRPIGVDLRGAKLKVNLDETSSLASFSIPNRRWQKTTTMSKRIIRKTTAFLETYRQHTAIVIIFIAINILVFLHEWWFFRYLTPRKDVGRVMGAGSAWARSAAGALMVDMAIILLTVCRNIITLLRETPIREYIPFDAAIAFHRIVAATIALFALIHTVAHCVNFYHLATQDKAGLQCVLFDALFNSDYLPSIAYWFYGTITGLTGVALVVVMSIIYVFALPPFMRKAYQAFRFTHYLNFAFYALTLLHGLPRLLGSPKFWYIVLGPLIIFVIDRIIGMRQQYKELKVVNAALLPSDIIYLRFKRPQAFRYRSGQWVRISSPSFSSGFNDLHSFSIASAPQAPTVELYIKAIGPWTWKLRSEILRAQANNTPYPMIQLRGPFGEGNQDWRNFEVSILVGGGIGITPYASTLADFALQVSSKKYRDFRCKKLYFIWVCPTHKSYEWFVDVLKNVEAHDDSGVLETHIFVTQFFHKFDLRTTMLYICEKHFRGEHAGVSMFTGLRAHNHFGRPNFHAFFRFIQARHRDQKRIGVFSCGPAPLHEMIGAGCFEANRVRDAPSFTHRYETF